MMNCPLSCLLWYDEYASVGLWLTTNYKIFHFFHMNHMKRTLEPWLFLILYQPAAIRWTGLLCNMIPWFTVLPWAQSKEAIRASKTRSPDKPSSQWGNFLQYFVAMKKSWWTNYPQAQDSHIWRRLQKGTSEGISESHRIKERASGHQEKAKPQWVEDGMMSLCGKHCPCSLSLNNCNIPFKLMFQIPIS